MNRRQFLTGGSTALFSVVANARTRADSQVAVREFRVPLRIPPVLSPVRSDSTTDYYEIFSRETTAEIIPGLPTRVWGYNGSFPGPTIEARRGRTVVVRHTNHLDRPTVVHLHGGDHRA